MFENETQTFVIQFDFGKCRGYNPAGEPGCEMWTFEKQEQKCSLYDSAEMKVKTIHELGYSFSLKLRRPSVYSF